MPNATHTRHNWRHNVDGASNDNEPPSDWEMLRCRIVVALSIFAAWVGAALWGALWYRDQIAALGAAQRLSAIDIQTASMVGSIVIMAFGLLCGLGISVWIFLSSSRVIAWLCRERN